MARAVEWEIVPVCAAEGLGLLPWSLTLAEDETRLLDAASDPGAPDYPYGERGQTHRNRRISGGRF
jgi:aryl-alcohol dehydrogenase-like predicted oxidoreductase